MEKINIEKSTLIEVLRSGRSKKEIAKQLNISRPTLNNLIKQHKVVSEYKYDRLVSGSRVSCNVKFFDIIDTEEKAYILGFFLADGWITSDGKNVGFAVQKQDIDILEKIQTALNHKGDLRYYVNSTGSDMVELKIGSIYMVNALIALGVDSNKSFTASIPKNITTDLIPSILRGLFDGDGSFYSNVPILTTNSKSIRNFIIDYCKAVYRSQPSDYTQQNKNGVFSYRLGFTSSLKPLLDAMYNQPMIVLDRKYTAYINHRNKQSTETEDKKPQ